MDLNPVVFDLQAKLCQVLGHSVRLKIIHALKEGALSVNTIASMVEVTQPTASRHLAILRSAGVLDTHRKGLEVYYEITSDKIIDVCETMRTVLAEQEAYRAKIFNFIQE